LTVPGGVLLCSYNIFGDKDVFDYTDALPAWLDCLNELEYRRAATGIPDMKMVISMSFGAVSTVPSVGQALQQLAAAWGDDVLWVASAGNDGNEIYNYPAAAPEVVSVGECSGGVCSMIQHRDCLSSSVVFIILQCAGVCS
jgi:hypothetical protein